MEEIPSFVERRIISCKEEMSTLMEAVDVKIEYIFDDLRVVKRVDQTVNDKPPSKLRVREPKSFEGARSLKVLEKFLWDMET